MSDREDEDRPAEGGFAHPPEGEQQESAEDEETLSDDELGEGAG